jgi:hypothetical protein
MANANLIIKTMIDRQMDVWLKGVTVGGDCVGCPQKDRCPMLVKAMVEAFKQYVAEVARCN